MMLRPQCTCLILWTTSYVAIHAEESPEHSNQPNVIAMLTDDLSYSDVGCCGTRKAKTPHIDRLAASATLQEGDVDLIEKTIRVTGKGGHQRVLPLTSQVVAALKAYRSARGSVVPASAFFRSRRGRQLTRNAVYERVRKYAFRLPGSDQRERWVPKRAAARNRVKGPALAA